ncbi:MAG: TylF/MycF/NovP-related O-methyltransferase [Gammaproteobacteria bacterium]
MSISNGLFRSKNRFDALEQEKAIEIIKQQADSVFVGDEMLVANRNMHFFEDPDFSNLLCILAQHPHYQGMAWRLHILCWAVSMSLRVNGCLMECGVFRGFKSLFIVKYFGDRLRDRTFYLCDTFDGIDESLNEGSPISKQEHRKVRLYDFVVHRFSEFSNVSVVRGSVPDSLSNLKITELAFLHLDMNSFKAELGALEYLWDRIPQGGVIVLDDFGFLSHRAQLKNELPWFSHKGQIVMELPTGQGLVIKQ